MKTRLILAALILTLLPCAACLAQVEVEARKIADTYKDAIVTVDLVTDVKITYEGQTEKSEQKHSTTATIIDPDGLAVTSLTQVSPDSYRDQSDSSNSYRSDIKDIKIRTADGTEIPADLVLRDRDLDLAFIRPKVKPAQPLAYLDVTKSSSPQVLDQVVVLSRLGQLANHASSARLDRIESVVTKPRTFYVIDGTFHQELGVPVFSLDSKCVGILVVRLNPSASRASSDASRQMYLSVLPCSTLANAMQQAKTAKPEVAVGAAAAAKLTPKPAGAKPVKPAPKKTH
jgi:hypothetical protein